MDNKKGLSAVVTTLLVILLVLVAVGVIWVVIRNVVESGAETIDISSKCIAVDVSAQSVTAVSGEEGNYSVTLKRNAGGDTIGGVKVNIFNSTASSGLIDFGATLGELETETSKIETNSVTNATKIEYTVYFVDDSGNEQFCSQTQSYTF